MTSLTPLRELPQPATFKAGDVFVLFGELFSRGYANGLVECARRAGMTIIGVTVGRRDADKVLRPLTDEELREAEAKLGGEIINIPLEAGFEHDDPGDGAPSMADVIKTIKASEWETFAFDWDHVERARKAGVERIQAATRQVMDEIGKRVPDGANVFFSHIMAGGIPKAKITLFVVNRVFKRAGEDNVSSERFWACDLGKLTGMLIDEVTANTFEHLVEASADIRDRVASSGGRTVYTAYGYHGTEILIGGDYAWQTYTTYVPGYAKMKLEGAARQAAADGIEAAVINCPEIRTNSSDVFSGVELSLYPLLRAIRKECSDDLADAMIAECQPLLNDGVTVDELLTKIDGYHSHPVIRSFHDFEAWPMDNTGEFMAVMLPMSDEITGMHGDKKRLISDYLSEKMLVASGKLIFDYAQAPTEPVVWLGHDIIAKQLGALVV